MERESASFGEGRVSGKQITTVFRGRRIKGYFGLSNENWYFGGSSVCRVFRRGWEE
jgi:hypothetical protein